MTQTETVTVEKDGNTFYLPRGSKKDHWPKALRPQNPDDYVGRQLQVTRSGEYVESVTCSEPGMEFSRSRPRQAQSDGAAEVEERRATFINPYNFVPFAGRPSDNPEGLKPGPPAGHDRFVPGTHTGILEFTLTTVTPLLLVDQSRAEILEGHKVLPTKVDSAGSPRLPASAVRGMLRSAYEAVTNSAFGVVDRRWSESLTKGKNAFGSAPSELADGHLPPARLADLTPADRLFGWVSGDESYAGQVRIEQPICTSGEWRGRSDTPLELAVLASPKPTYYRFYLEGSDGGDPASTRGGYVRGGRLRGWKTYVHHRNAPASAQEFEKYVGVRRYQHAQKKKVSVQPGCDVTVSVRDWVGVGATFEVRLRVHNLSDAEFGGLLWLLLPGEKTECRFRLGMGRPLGFGTVRARDVKWTRFCPESRYSGEGAGAKEWSLDDLSDVRDGFAALWSPAAQLEAYRRTMRGWEDAPVHYPLVRSSSGKTPVGQPGYVWFQENEKKADRRKSLPELAVGEASPALPVFENALKGVTDIQDPPPCGRRATGSVKWFDSEKGYGFIVPASGDKDVHVRRESVPDGDLKSGQRVEYELALDSKGRPIARGVRVIKGGW